jgi:hypothetical protein
LCSTPQGRTMSSPTRWLCEVCGGVIERTIDRVRAC